MLNKKSLIMAAVFVALITGLLGYWQGYNRELSSMEKIDIFFNEVDRMGLLNCEKYELSENGIWIIHKRYNESTYTVSFYSRPINIGTLEPGESKKIQIAY